MNQKINAIVIFSIINIILYLFFFSDFGYFELKDKTIKKEILEKEVEALLKENQTLENKLLKEDVSKEKINIYLFKFVETINDTKKHKKSHHIFRNEKEYYLLLYFFYCFIGYLYIAFFQKKLTKTE